MAVDVSVVSPVYKCVGCLEELVERVLATLGGKHSLEIVLVDDGSPDGAWSRILELAEVRPEVRGLRLSRNFGQHAAIAAGLQYATGRVVVVMDCDLQDLPEEIPGLVAAVRNGHDLALAQRVSRQDTYLKRQSSRVFYFLLGWLTDSKYDHTTANFGAYDRTVVNALNALPEAERFLPLLVNWIGFDRALVPVTHGDRKIGKTSYTVRQLLRLALNVALAFSDKPLRLVVKAGLAFAAVAVLIAGYSVYRYAAGDVSVAGFTSIIASVWLVGSIIVSCLGIVGLYVGKVFTQAKGRPHYIIAKQTPWRCQ